MSHYKCAKCHTEYFEPGECDWCPGVQRTPLARGPCEDQLRQVAAHARRLEVKAAKWDALVLACHRFGSRCKELYEYVNQKVRER